MITLRSTKGSRLTTAEMDANFSGLADGSNLTALAASSGSSLVGTIAAGAGAVARTVQAKERDVVSVKDFGAVGDVVTDDRAAVISAVVAAAGRVILFPPGTYKIGSAYAAPDGTRFYMQAGASFTTNQPTGASIQYERNQATGTAGSVMKVDHLFEFSSYPLNAEGGIWPDGTYTYFGVSKEMTATTTTGEGSGPLAGHFSFVQNNGALGDVVAYLGDAVARTANGTVFGANFIARNGAVNGAKLVGYEVDIEPAVGTTISGNSKGGIYNVYSIASDADVVLVGGVSGGTWRNGYITSHIRGAHYSVNSGDPTTATSFINTINGTFSNGALVTGLNAAQAWNLGGASFGTSPLVYASSSYDFIVNMGASGYIILKNIAGVDTFWFSNDSTFFQKTLTVGALPAAGTIGRRAVVTDANATTFASIVAAGGANKVPVFDNGTNWVIG